jgi:mono/diheme cytochrome c family protein
MNTRTRLCSITVAAALAAAAGLAVPQAAMSAKLGSAVRGEAIALEICSDCHVVSDKQVRVGVVGLPSFRQIANDPEKTEFWLRTFMRTPHFEMPDFVFSPDQIDDLIAYITSLKEPAGQ